MALGPGGDGRPEGTARRWASGFGREHYRSGRGTRPFRGTRGSGGLREEERSGLGSPAPRLGRRAGRRGRHLGPAGRRHTLPGSQAHPPRPCRPHLGGPSRRRPGGLAAGRAGSGTHGPATVQGAQFERAQRGRHRAREAGPALTVLSQPVPAHPRRPAPGPWGRPALSPPPGGTPPPQPARTGSPGTAVPHFLPPCGPSPLPARDPRPVPAHLARPQFRGWGRLSHSRLENPRRDLAPPGLSSGWSQGPHPRAPPPAPGQPRFLASNPPPSSRPRPDPTRPHCPTPAPPREMRSAAAPRTSRASSAGRPAALKFLEIPPPRLPALAALPPARPGPAWALGSRSRPSAHSSIVPVIFTLLYLIMQDGIGSSRRAGWHDSARCPVQPDCL